MAEIRRIRTNIGGFRATLGQFGRVRANFGQIDRCWVSSGRSRADSGRRVCNSAYHWSTSVQISPIPVHIGRVGYSCPKFGSTWPHSVNFALGSDEFWRSRPALPRLGQTSAWIPRSCLALVPERHLRTAAYLIERCRPSRRCRQRGGSAVLAQRFGSSRVDRARRRGRPCEVAFVAEGAEVRRKGRPNMSRTCFYRARRRENERAHIFRDLSIVW